MDEEPDFLRKDGRRDETVRRDEARISAEFSRFTHGTDPFPEAVRTTRMPMLISDARRPDLPVVFVNDAFCRLTLYPRDEILGRNCRFLQGPETDKAAVAQIRRALARSESIEVEIRNYRKDGTSFWNRLLIAPVHDANGELAYFFASQMDVTAERERLAGLETHNAALTAELAGLLQAQRESEARLRFAAQAGRMGIWELDLPTLALTASPEAREIFGHPRDEELSYAAKLAAIHPHDRPARDAAFARAVETGCEYNIEYRVIPRSGPSRWVHVRAQVAHGLDGKAMRIAGVAMDVTARREASEGMQAQIDAALAERAKVEEALRQAQKMEAVGQLTGGIAHDFNNLLAGIMGSLEMIQRRAAAGRTDGVERYIGAALTSAQRATALTQRLLAFARRQPLDPKRVEANQLLAGMEDLLRRTLGPAVALEMRLAGDLWATLCDPNQLDSALLNLAINARDAMQGGGRLVVETANVSLDEAWCDAQGGEVRPGDYIAISVTDTGVGMPPEVIAKAFDPFFTTKPTGQGTGLGLSMVYGFVKQSQGHVAIESAPGRGTVFRLFLPRLAGEQRQEGEQDMEDETAQRAMAGETVLVVDDEATVRMLVTETLEELGYGAIEAGDGTSGLEILQSGQRVDLLVTDVGLPGLNGRQLADAARVLRPTLKVLFMTGYAHNAAVGNGSALEAGMEIITKPFSLDALGKKIQEMIEGG